MEMSAEFVALGLMWFIAFLLSTTVHEAAHALVAWRLGDPTAYEGGQVSLNPLPHIVREPFGMVLVPILTYGLAGWVMGWASAPYDPFWADRHPKRAGLMALAGPVSNLLLAIFAGLTIRAGLAWGYFVPPEQPDITNIVAAGTGGGLAGLTTFLSIFFVLNVLLFTFNQIPVPPLDGSSVLALVLSDDAARSFQNFMRQPGFSLIGILVAWRLIGQVFGPVLRAAISLLYA